MREIKFRAWDKENNKMIGPFEVGSVLSETWPPEMQYTGLKDKNGKEIYEGDILERDDGKIIIVKFGEQDHQENYGDIFRYVGFNLCLAYGYAELYKYKHKTIGNIHENPELLKE